MTKESEAMNRDPQDHDTDLAAYADLLERLLGELARLPPVLSRKLEAEIQELLELVRDRRPPRFLLAGRRGAGKSTLLNAVFGKKVAEIGSVTAQTGRATWHSFADGDRKVDLLDTRGWAEGEKPKEADDAETSFESIVVAMEEKRPDVIMFIVPAGSVDAHIDNDLDQLEKILEAGRSMRGGELPLVAVVTQCDHLDPCDERLPTSDEEKLGNIRLSREALRDRIAKRPDLNERLAAVIPVAAWARYRRDGTIDPARDYRWNMTRLVESLLNELPNQARLDFARIAQVRKFQRSIAKRIVEICSVASGGIGVQPIPFADLPFITSIQGVMILAVGYVAGKPLAFETAREMIVALGGNVGLGLGAREIARALLKLIPGAGNIASGAVAGGVTYAIGRAAIAYFIDDIDPATIRKDLEDQDLGAGAA